MEAVIKSVIRLRRVRKGFDDSLVPGVFQHEGLTPLLVWSEYSINLYSHVSIFAKARRVIFNNKQTNYGLSGLVYSLRFRFCKNHWPPASK